MDNGVPPATVPGVAKSQARLSDLSTALPYEFTWLAEEKEHLLTESTPNSFLNRVREERRAQLEVQGHAPKKAISVQGF